MSLDEPAQGCGLGSARPVDTGNGAACLDDSGTGRHYLYGLDALLRLTLGFELIPTGVMGLQFSYPTETGTTTAEVTATFDGTEWVYVQVRLGYYQAAFCLNIVTGEVRYC